MSGKRVVLTADRSLMTNYRGNFLYGFIACGPYEVLPEWVFDKVFCPPVETDTRTGEAKVAQVGLRRVESALLKEYDRNDVFVANPDYLERCVGPDTKVLGTSLWPTRTIWKGAWGPTPRYWESTSWTRGWPRSPPPCLPRSSPTWL